MYGRRMAQHLLFFYAVLISLAIYECNALDQNVMLPGKDNFCDVKKGMSRLEELMINVTKDLREMRNEFGKEIKALWKYIEKEKTEQPQKNCSKALFFSGSTNEYAKLDKGARLVGNVSLGALATDGGLDAMTSCFWIKIQKNTDEPTVLSYAVPERDNEFVIYFVSSNIRVMFKDAYHPTGQGGLFNTRIWVGDDKWHHVCITWKSRNGRVEAYKDGVSYSYETGVITGQRIAPSGIWIIGQDQDIYGGGGGFEKEDAFQGSLTEVNVWDRILDASEISTLASINCGLGMQGNYKAYKDFAPQGDVRKVQPSCCR